VDLDTILIADTPTQTPPAPLRSLTVVPLQGLQRYDGETTESPGWGDGVRMPHRRGPQVGNPRKSLPRKSREWLQKLGCLGARGSAPGLNLESALQTSVAEHHGRSKRRLGTTPPDRLRCFARLFLDKLDVQGPGEALQLVSGMPFEDYDVVRHAGVA
jgi:hypothetical protein